jgi:hypothetical protein
MWAPFFNSGPVVKQTILIPHRDEDDQTITRGTTRFPIDTCPYRQALDQERPDCSDKSCAIDNGVSAPVPLLNAAQRSCLSVHAPEGFSACLSALALTVPGSLPAQFRHTRFHQHFWIFQ